MKACRNWVFNRQIVIYPPLEFKDIDETLRNDKYKENFLWCLEKGIQILLSENLKNNVEFLL